MRMCSISGILELKRDPVILEKMLRTMVRRGPDDAGIYEQGKCCLLHTRLAVIDPEGGHQPMALEWAGERYGIVYNGELYNTRELRHELLGLGHSFHGHSDTEVVLHSYAQWGSACLERFNGIFALAIWEENRQRLFAARDRMGVKPFFYKQHENGLLFASEIKTILAYPTVQARLDATGVGEILLLGPGRTPGSGVFKGILELEPGCCGYYENSTFRTRRYWQLRDRIHKDSFGDTVEMVRWLVTDAIRRQMVSDVSLGTFLSGGLDSSIITAVCAGEMKRRGEVLKTFSVDYENNDRYFVPGKFQPNSDNHFIRAMVKHLGTDHRTTVLTPEDLLSNLETATVARDLPGMADVDFSLLAFCGEIRKEVTVALSGECADEIFGGYPWYRDLEIQDREGFPWAQNTFRRAGFLHPQWEDQLDAESFVMDRYRQTLAECDILPENSGPERRMKEMVNLNHRWFMQTLLDRKDRMSMYHALEVRVPFCDYRIAEYLYGVPWDYKDHRHREKGLLRQAMSGLLPGEILWRKKSPYPKTYDPRYLELVSGAIRALMADAQAPVWTLVRKEAVEQMLHAEYAWPWYGQLMQVPQTLAYLLQINVWLTYYKISVI